MLESDQTQDFPELPVTDVTADSPEEDSPHSTEKRRRRKTSAGRMGAGSEPNPYDRLPTEPPETFGEVQ